MDIFFYRAAVMGALLYGENRVEAYYQCVEARVTSETFSTKNSGATSVEQLLFGNLRAHYSFHKTTAPSKTMIAKWVEKAKAYEVKLTEFPFDELLHGLLVEYEKLAIKNVMSDAAKLPGTTKEKIAVLKRGIAAVEHTAAKPAVSMAASAPDFVADMLAPAPAIFESGLTQLDEGTGGLQKGMMWVHGAASNGMKSVFAMNWAYNVAMDKRRYNGLFLSLETATEIVQKHFLSLLSTDKQFRDRVGEVGFPDLSGIPMRMLERKLNSEDPTPDQIAFVGEVATKYKAVFTNIVLVGTADTQDRPNISAIREMVALHKKRGGLDFVVIDHADLVGTTAGAKNNTDATLCGAVLQDLATIARDENVAMLVCNQLNSTAAERALLSAKQGSIPMYSQKDMANTGKAFQAAKTVSISFMNKQLRDMGQVLLQVIKNKGEMPEPFLAAYDKHTLRLYDAELFGLSSVPESVIKKEEKDATPDADKMRHIIKSQVRQLAAIKRNLTPDEVN